MEHWSYDAAVGAVQSDTRGVYKDVDNSLLPFQSDRKTVPRYSVSSSVIAAKAESDAQLSKLIDAMLSKLESEENSISDEETDSLETLVQICDVYRYFIRGDERRECLEGDDSPTGEFSDGGRLQHF